MIVFNLVNMNVSVFFSVIYQIHDFCVNSFLYHNGAVGDDYHSYNHYRTSDDSAREVVAAFVAARRPSAAAVASDTASIDRSATSRCSCCRHCSDDESEAAVAAAVAVVEYSMDSRIHWVIVERPCPAVWMINCIL